jgi:hypothetical protein
MTEGIDGLVGVLADGAACICPVAALQLHFISI